MNNSENSSNPIGVFDSGYGGLTILNEIRKKMPHYDFLYLGDNARSPYGTRSLEVVYQFTLECVEYLFNQGCKLVILACNTASAKALSKIEKNKKFKAKYPNRKILGIIKPTVQSLEKFTRNNKIGLFATNATVDSRAYLKKIRKKYLGKIELYSVACPMWVPLIENGEHLGQGEGVNFFIKKYTSELLRKNNKIDSVILGCTHYPLLEEKIRKELGENIRIISQGEIVADYVVRFLLKNSEIDQKCSKNGTIEYLTTENSEKFSFYATLFLSEKIDVKHIEIKQ